MKDGFNIEIGEFEDFKNKILCKKPEIELKEIKGENMKKNYDTPLMTINTLQIDDGPTHFEKKKKTRYNKR